MSTLLHISGGVEIFFGDGGGLRIIEGGVEKFSRCV